MSLLLFLVRCGSAGGEGCGKNLPRARESFLVSRCLRLLTYTPERMTNTRQILYRPLRDFLERNSVLSCGKGRKCP